MDDELRQTDDPAQAGRLIEIGDNRHGTLRTPEGRLVAVAQQGEDTVAAAQKRQQPPSNITTTDDQ